MLGIEREIKRVLFSSFTGVYSGNWYRKGNFHGWSTNLLNHIKRK